ncbi:Bug family tripartite tricarboxylate transporter substrate binding protein [Afipia felis]|uniref:Argininosuccinate lyase n=2 Tax=Afipia felis TaxID=1035 RepID=A0A380WBX7_AFIFE|nr:tripartite tricarboxylate transporter substrate binding protein [Afipia felis]EKS29366.1 hypothetical protein HMPREF9697_01894 [Afipia felis ATCC 53690]SUU78074.1 Argininosuccinate lyase [Afipia felis]SUU86139.1 Argininosuccinate lyase [Afipia felis]
MQGFLGRLFATKRIAVPLSKPATVLKCALLGALAFVPLSTQAAFADKYPEKPIKIVVPFPAGGPTDVAARLIAQALSTRIGGTVVVENVGGAGGRIGAKAVAHAAPDGYTLLLGGTNVNALVGALYKNPGFDPIKSFAPVATICTDSMAMVITPRLPAKTFPEFVDYARKNPGKLQFGAPPGIYTHIVGEFVKIKTGTDLLFIPYKGGSPAISDALGGHIEVVFNNKSTLLNLIKDDQLRALAVTSAARWPELPEIPTLKELGLEGFPTEILFGLLAPAGTPAEIVEKLNHAVNDGLKSDEVRASVAKLGMEVKSGSVKDFDDALGEQVTAWTNIVNTAGIKVE